jgi:hypothetical protein
MRRRPPQRSEDEKSITASAVIIPTLLSPTKPAENDSEAAVRGRSGHDKAIAAVGAYLRVSGP